MVCEKMLMINFLYHSMIIKLSVNFSAGLYIDEIKVYVGNNSYILL